MGNNLLLVAGMAIVLLGTLYPLFLDAVGGGRITVGGPYFESVFGSAMVPLAFLVPVGAVCAWKSQSIDRMGRLLGLPLAVALVLGLLTPVLLGAWSTVMALAAFLTYWIVFGAAADWVRYARTARAQKRSVFGQTLPLVGHAYCPSGACAAHFRRGCQRHLSGGARGGYAARSDRAGARRYASL